MDDFPTKIADFLEQTAHKVRSLTVDRVEGWAKWTAIGLVLGMMGLLLLIFLLVGLFRLLTELIGVQVAYAAIGGIFVLVGVLLWRKRIPPPAEEE
jgi:hypothetical protein